METENNGKEFLTDDPYKEIEMQSELPILTLHGSVIFPLTVTSLNIVQPSSIKLVHDVVKNSSRFVGLVTIKNEGIEEPGPSDVYMMGTVAIINRLIHVSDDSVQLIIQGVERIRIKEFTLTEPYFKARIELAKEDYTKNNKIEALMRNTIEFLRTLISLASHLPDELLAAAISIEDPRQFVYLIATNFRMGMKETQELLESNKIEDKLYKLNTFLRKEIEIYELGKKIQSQAQSELDKNQRDYILREQLRQIKKELGEEDEEVIEIKEYEKKIVQAQLSMEAAKEAQRELNRMRTMPSASSEYQVIKTYLDWLVDLPWNKFTEDNLDIQRAKKILDEDHYDMKTIKERILEYLSVRKLRTERDKTNNAYNGSILCFVGPPGVGKTSLGQSIARALDRKFARISLGGIHDEGEIRGHRRTYVGALPGRIIQSIKRVASRNPVMMLDEIDKIGTDFRGDPSSALLEVLDPAQNRTFSDHYLDVAFDLSQVIFICTANHLDTVQPALRDRMEIINLPGYTEDEKAHIAIDFLIPRQIKENGLTPEEIKFESEAIHFIVQNYTREAGVRNLEREIGSICRKIATLIADKQVTSFKVTNAKVIELLGKEKYYSEIAERTTIPGVATGLAVTTGGGEILFIEATQMPGSKGFMITGQLGTVMTESAQAALSYIRSKASDLGIDAKIFEKVDIHLHIPEGATPKDGPSAGVTMATALASLMTKRAVKNDVGMTGEITLRGRVLPVGGIKEKVLAAHRAGLKTIILPKRNLKDLDDLSEDIRKELKFVFVENMTEVFNAALNATVSPQEGDVIPKNKLKKKHSQIRHSAHKDMSSSIKDKHRKK